MGQVLVGTASWTDPSLIESHEFYPAGVDSAEEMLDFLEANGIAYTAVDEPQGFSSSIPPVNAVTSDALAVVRMHGRNVETWDKPGLPPSERFKYLYNEEELVEWVRKIDDMARQVRRVHVLFNNNYGGYAVRNALQMKALLHA